MEMSPKGDNGFYLSMTRVLRSWSMGPGLRARQIRTKVAWNESNILSEA